MSRQAIEFIPGEGVLLLRYTPRDDTSWVHRKFSRSEPLTIKGTWHFRPEHLAGNTTNSDSDDDFAYEADTVTFTVAVLAGEYFKFDKQILAINVELLIHQDVPLTSKSFTAEKRVSIFALMASLGVDRIVIGGPLPDAIPETAFNDLVERFPSAHELKRYALARVASVIREHIETRMDAERLYRRYVEKRLDKRVHNMLGLFREAEVAKYRFLHEKLVAMLKSEETYNETTWQAEIRQIILLINPKYIKAVREIPVRDDYQGKSRKIDIGCLWQYRYSRNKAAL
jgi:hypothetical protein